MHARRYPKKTIDLYLVTQRVFEIDNTIRQAKPHK